MFTATHLHAMIVHFPVALVLVAFVSELIGYILKKPFYLQASFYILVLAGLGAIVAYITGNAAGDGMDGGSLQKALESHEGSATFTLWLTIAAAGAKIVIYFVKNEMRWLKILAFILLFAAAGSVARTGYLGGQLVFKHAAGVELGIGNFDALQKNNE
jgi:uncharacterized membrane protein